MNRILIILILLCPVVGYSQYCTPDNRFTEVEYFTDTQIEKDTGVVYATNVIDWQGNSQDLALDFYYPDTTIDPLSSRPFILLIHGGGFKNGSKSGLSRHCEEFAKRGYVASSLQYRLGWDTTGSALTNQPPAIYRAQQDANAAMRFIIENANDYQIDTSWMFIGGQSAGSITALGTHYMDQIEWNAVFPTYETSYGSIDTSGNNFTHEFHFKGLFNNWGNTLGAAIETNELIPMISFHGVLDNTTPIGNSNGRYGSAVIHDTLLSNNICSELTVDSTGGHGIYKENTGIDFRVMRASCFFKSLFCNNCSSMFYSDSISANCSTPMSVIEAEHNKELFKVYPNPVNDFLAIIGVVGNYEINVIDITGKIITTNEMLEGNKIINVSNFTKGIYLIQIINQENGKFEQIKFIKE